MIVKRSAYVVLALALFPLAACFNVGTRAENFKVASEPNGAMAHITSSVGEISGELLAIHDDGVIILSSAGMELVPYASIHSLHLDQLDGSYGLSGDAPVAARRDRLAAVSRYPQGIDARLQQRLLTQLHQPALLVVQ